MVYDRDALQRIETAIAAIGPCERRQELLEHIEQSAQDWLPRPVTVDPTTAALLALGFGQRHMEAATSPREVRDQLNKLATALTAMARVGGMSLGADLHLAWAAQERGVEISPYLGDFLNLANRLDLAELAEVANTAAAGVEVRKGPRTNENLNRFIDALYWQVEHFTGRRPTLSENWEHCREAPYGGRFFELVTACLEPLGIRMTNHALGGAIERVLDARKG